MKPSQRKLHADEPRLAKLVALCKRDLLATEVWLFGSRARGDADLGSDWDILVVVPDTASGGAEQSRLARLKRIMPLRADIVVMRARDFARGQDTFDTIVHVVTSEGLRIDR